MDQVIDRQEPVVVERRRSSAGAILLILLAVIVLAVLFFRYAPFSVGKTSTNVNVPTPTVNRQ